MPLIFSICDHIFDQTGTDLQPMIEKSKDQLVIRFLHYFPLEPGQKTLAADPHIDKGLFTIHLWEDLPGLQLKWNDMWFSVEPKDDHVLFYPGLIGQYHTKCGVIAMCHQVVTSPETEAKGRYAIVMFVDGGNKKSDKAKKGPTQGNFNNGQNYTMSVEQINEFLTETTEAVD